MNLKKKEKKQNSHYKCLSMLYTNVNIYKKDRFKENLIMFLTRSIKR